MTTQHTALLGAFIAIIVLCTLHFSALSFFLYWKYWWFDLLTHFLGGVVIGCGALWFLHGLGLGHRYGKLGVLGGTLLIGVMWECFEYAVGLYDPATYILDTPLDLLMDVLGALAAYYVVRRYYKDIGESSLLPHDDTI